MERKPREASQADNAPHTHEANYVATATRDCLAAGPGRAHGQELMTVSIVFKRST